MAELDRLREAYYAETVSYDAVLMPSSPILPPNVERLDQDHDYYVNENLLALRNTRIGNLMGACAFDLADRSSVLWIDAGLPTDARASPAPAWGGGGKCFGMILLFDLQWRAGWPNPVIKRI